MNKDTLNRLQKLNQLQLTEAEEQSVLGFFEKRDAELALAAEAEKEGTEDSEEAASTVIESEDGVKRYF